MHCSFAAFKWLDGSGADSHWYISRRSSFVSENLCYFVKVAQMWSIIPGLLDHWYPVRKDLLYLSQFLRIRDGARLTICRRCWVRILYPSSVVEEKWARPRWSLWIAMTSVLTEPWTTAEITGTPLRDSIKHKKESGNVEKYLLLLHPVLEYHKSHSKRQFEICHWWHCIELSVVVAFQNATPNAL
jgi:hypothetical protein